MTLSGPLVQVRAIRDMRRKGLLGEFVHVHLQVRPSPAVAAAAVAHDAYAAQRAPAQPTAATHTPPRHSH